MHCTHCGKKLNPDNRFCTSCGNPNPYYVSNDTASLHAQQNTRQNSKRTYDAYDNHSDRRPHSRPDNYRYHPNPVTQVPGKFNWGAFSLTIPWGIGNRCYICLLALIPGLNIIMSFIAGFSGNNWAMKNNDYRDMEEFSRIQETWNHAGFVFFIIAIIPIIIFLLLAFFGLMTAPSLSNNFL